VFGRHIEAANCRYLSLAKAGESILIIGGGSGKILKHTPKQAKVDFVDSSAAMIRLARKNSLSTHNIRFIQKDFAEVDLDPYSYDYVVCPFFLDLYKSGELPQILGKISTLMKQEARLLVSDLKLDGKFLLPKRIFVFIIILFFKLFTGLRVWSLADIPALLASEGYKQLEMNQQYGGMIFSSVWVINRH
jgi:ubiquinone/menaquinone biosynthesis C-methylase UbiE